MPRPLLSVRPIDAAPALRQGGAVKSILTLLLILAAVLPSSAGERVVLYVTLLQSTATELSDGTKWQMDKGDCFPVVSYKESHTKVILQIASATFMVALTSSLELTIVGVETRKRGCTRSVGTHTA